MAAWAPYGDSPIQEDRSSAFYILRDPADVDARRCLEWGPPHDVRFRAPSRINNMPLRSRDYDEVPPEPGALIESLRSVGYNLPTAVADIIDNSIAADAKTIHIDFHWAGDRSHVVILDDGFGMTEEKLRAAMRPGSRNPLEERGAKDLGRFGLGLKTASLSHCRNLCVASRPPDGRVAVRTWDLDILAKSHEWRLLKQPSPLARDAISRLEGMSSGTVVVWSSLDRLIGSETVGDAVAHNRFNDAIDEVREHLALTFHRFLEERTVRIHINGKPVLPWNPFMKDGRVPSSASPEEFIPFGRSGMTFQGFVLPHKDALSDDEFARNGGPRGWTAQQGFYVYRNKRLLVCGDWLGLGRPSPWTREEHYRLVRIRLDISNDSDAAWHLDVKKSTAKPPALVRNRLTDLADAMRVRARSVFVHRGKFGRRPAAPTETERPWLSKVREGRRVYSINRSHPAVLALLQTWPEEAPGLEAVLRLLEETVPVEQIWLDTAEQACDHAAPYSGVELTVIKSDMRRILDFLIQGGINHQTAIERLMTIEPFDRYRNLIHEL